jgi:hypothetical protein
MNSFHGTLNIKPDVPVVLTEIVALNRYSELSVSYKSINNQKLAPVSAAGSESAAAGSDPRFSQSSPLLQASSFTLLFCLSFLKQQRSWHLI